MDYVTAYINLGGDVGNVMFRDFDRPVSWPEVTVLQFLHGADAVFNCVFVSSEATTPQREKNRLIGIYGADPVNTLYPGARPMMEMDFPGDKTPAGEKRPVKVMAPTRDTRERDKAEELENAESIDIPPVLAARKR